MKQEYVYDWENKSLRKLPENHAWHTPAKLVREHNAPYVVELVPDLWQIRRQLFRALEDEPVTIVHVKPWQKNALDSITAQLKQFGIVTSRNMLPLCKELKIQPAFILCIGTASDDTPPPLLNLTYEVHCAPSLIKEGTESL